MTPAADFTIGDWIGMGLMIGALSIIVRLLRLWFAPKPAPKEIDAPLERAQVPIVVPTCAACGAIVWENRNHGNRFCQDGHEDPEIIYKEIAEFVAPDGPRDDR